jgi:hypothetical protein
MIDTLTARAACSRAIHFVKMAVVPAVFLLASTDIPAYAAARPKNDLLVNLGSKGLWVYKNKTTWQRLDSGTPSGIAVGDLNGDGIDDVIYGLANPAARRGTYTRIGSTLPPVTPVKIDPRIGVRIAAGDVDGDGRADLVATFKDPATGNTVPGTYHWVNDSPAAQSPFFQVHPSTAIGVAMGDLEGDNIADVIAAFPNGIHVCFDGQSPWVPLNPTATTTRNFVLGDFNADGRDDLLVDRATQGVWRSMDGGTTWVRINTHDAAALATGDPDGNLRDGPFATFPGTTGGLFTSPTATASPAWTRLTTVKPSIIAVGRLDSGAKEDVLMINPSNPNIIYVRMNNTGAFNPLPMPGGPGAPVKGILFMAFD